MLRCPCGQSTAAVKRFGLILYVHKPTGETCPRMNKMDTKAFPLVKLLADQDKRVWAAVGRCYKNNKRLNGLWERRMASLKMRKIGGLAEGLAKGLDLMRDRVEEATAHIVEAHTAALGEAQKRRDEALKYREEFLAAKTTSWIEWRKRAEQKLDDQKLDATEEYYKVWRTMAPPFCRECKPGYKSGYPQTRTQAATGEWTAWKTVKGYEVGVEFKDEFKACREASAMAVASAYGVPAGKLVGPDAEFVVSRAMASFPMERCKPELRVHAVPYKGEPQAVGEYDEMEGYAKW